MKKGFILILVLIFLLSISLVSAVFEDNCRCKEFCDEGNYCYFGVCSEENLKDLNCSNDGVSAEPCPACPACNINSACLDGNVFMDTADCLSYFDTLIVDPACRRTFYFSIFDKDTGSPLSGASISLTNLVDGIDYTAAFLNSYSEMTKTKGDFVLPRCQEVELVTIVASKMGYDAAVVLDNITNDKSDVGKILNYTFNLPIGICHADCTDSFNRCNPECEGFANTTDTCNFYTNLAYPEINITHLCAYKEKGTSVNLETEDNSYLIIDCCEGEGGVQTIARPQSKIMLTDSENLISTQKLVKFTDNNPGKLYVYYWD